MAGGGTGSTDLLMVSKSVVYMVGCRGVRQDLDEYAEWLVSQEAPARPDIIVLQSLRAIAVHD